MRKLIDKKKVFIFFVIFVLTLFFSVRQTTRGQTGRDYVKINITLSPTSAWWNDTITASGHAVWNNEDPFNQTVSVRKDNIEVCSTTANIITGFYSCNFYAPLELGNYNYIAYAINLTGIASNSSAKVLNVKLNYGQAPIGQTERVVYEQPMLIQEPDGRIRIAWARVKIWRGL
jgi:hypothetical protein